MRPVIACLAALIVACAPRAAPAVDIELETPPELSSVRARIKAKDFKGAIDELTPMLSTKHADVYNLMGFSLRKLGDYKQAYAYYLKALQFDPDHRGALEYLGELFVETGQIDRARENAALLRKLCPAGCEELADLEKAIAAAAK